MSNSSSFATVALLTKALGQLATTARTFQKVLPRQAKGGGMKDPRSFQTRPCIRFFIYVGYNYEDISPTIETIYP